MKPDGLRGQYGSGLITPEVFYRLPWALRQVVSFDCLVIGRDPRPHSDILHQALIDGARATGVAVQDVGIVPTPMLAKCLDGRLGLMVTASHNPASDNGVKILGHVLDEWRREEVALYLTRPLRIGMGVRGTYQSAQVELQNDYLRMLSTLPKQRKRCLFDTAGGAWASHSHILQEMGLDISVYQPKKTSREINQTGSLHVADIVYPDGFEYVLAVDGDGDRLQIKKGRTTLDGDDMLLHLSKGEKGVVGTPMSNTVLEKSLAKGGVRFYRASVGDYYVCQKILKHGLRYGAEPCGHVIDIEWMQYSDPVYMFLKLLSLGDIKAIEGKAYQKQFTLPSSTNFSQIEAQYTHPNIRSVIRYSNTEPVIRVLLEGERSLVESLMH